MIKQIINNYNTLTWSAYKGVESGNLHVLCDCTEVEFLDSDFVPDLRFLQEKPPLPNAKLIDVTCSQWLDLSVGTNFIDLAVDILGDGCMFIDVLTYAQDLRFTFNHIIETYPNIFTGNNKSTDSSLLANFGALKLILNLVPLTGHTFHELLGWSLYEVLNLISFSIVNAEYEESRLRETLKR